ncbi:MAG TPA: hypothetical protein VFM65_09420 [Flavobacteriaceae bacterium]|nr:hypothetical protein [Flavobacteriaceae bacterium]
MKPIIFTFLVLFFGCFAGCDNSDNDIDDPTIYGSWNLMNISGGFAGVDNDFERGTIIWTFDGNSSELVVENNNTEEVIDGLDSGTYMFSISGSDTLFVEGGRFGVYTVSKTQLIIDQGVASDGFLLKFER